MNDTAELEYPTLPDVQTALTAPAALDLEKIDLQTLALAKYATASEQAAAAVATLTGVQHDLSTQAKVDEAKSLRHRLIGQPLADMRKVTKALKSRLAAVSKAVGAKDEAVEAQFNVADRLITPQIEAREGELQAERDERARVEAERKQRHEDALAKLSGAVARAREKGATSAEIADGIARLEAMVVGDGWEEYRDRAEAARSAAVQALRALHAEVKARDEQAADNERLRLLAAQQAAELERLRVEAAERSAREAERIEAEQKAEAEEAARMEAERIADMQADAPKHQDAELVLAEAPLAPDTAQATEYPEGPAAQQVLKAEAATPDATDRATPADASQVGGPVGAGQPAAAGRAGGTRIIIVEPEEPTDPTDTMDEAVAFVALVLTAFDSKFPTHPKPPPEWWANVRKHGEALQARLAGGAWCTI